jgi:hypothetical protein
LMCHASVVSGVRACANPSWQYKELHF